MKAVLFDLFGVLVNYRQGSFSYNFKRAFKPKASIDEIQEARQDLYRKASEGKITRAEFWRLFFKRVGKFDNAEPVMLDMIKLKSRGIPSMLKKLRKKYKLAVVSNQVDYWARYLLKKFKILDYFDAVIISSNVGVRKPHSKIYLAACRRLKAKPEECVYIGDSDDDIKGAKALGMKTIFIPGESKNAEADFRIKHLKELLKILDS